VWDKRPWCWHCRKGNHGMCTGARLSRSDERRTVRMKGGLFRCMCAWNYHYLSGIRHREAGIEHYPIEKEVEVANRLPEERLREMKSAVVGHFLIPSVWPNEQTAELEIEAMCSVIAAARYRVHRKTPETWRGLNEAVKRLDAVVPRDQKPRETRKLEYIIDPERLDLLADWFDRHDATFGHPGIAVQTDLRAWAAVVRAARRED